MSEHPQVWLGVVADDVTGAVDLAGSVTAAGLRTVIRLGVPDPSEPLPDCDCAVVALTTRTAPAESAVAASAAAARWLLDHGTAVLYQKYCSTFDSTDRGNIGPVADALADLVAQRSGGPSGVSVGTPATPQVGRTQYLGHLFVGGRLLSESSLRNHPLTPMRDPDLVRVLGRQTAGTVALVPLPDLRHGPDTLRAALDRSTTTAVAAGPVHVLVDALDDSDLDLLAQALLAIPSTPTRTPAPDPAPQLVGGAAGLATALARAHAHPFRGDDALRRQECAAPDPLPTVLAGRALVISGSCSERTREQVARHTGRHIRLSASDLARDAETTVDRAVQQVVEAWADDPDAIPVVASTVDPEQLRAEQEEVGPERAAALVESALGQVARRAVEHGARRLLVAGGETSGAVTEALDIRALHVGDPVEPGLAWTVSATEPHMALLLKSGNFGTPDLFRTAWESCP